MKPRPLPAFLTLVFLVASGPAVAGKPAADRPVDGTAGRNDGAQTDRYRERDPGRSPGDATRPHRSGGAGVPVDGPGTAGGDPGGHGFEPTPGMLHEANRAVPQQAEGLRSAHPVATMQEAVRRELDRPLGDAMLAAGLAPTPERRRDAAREIDLYVERRLRQPGEPAAVSPAAARQDAADRLTLARRDAAKPELRREYQDAVRNLQGEAFRLLQAGGTKQAVAVALHDARRALGQQYKDLTPPDLLRTIHARNRDKYGDPLGPSVAWLRDRGRSWDQIIEASARPGPWPMMQAGDRLPDGRDPEPARQRPGPEAAEAQTPRADGFAPIPFLPSLELPPHARASLKAQVDRAIAERLAARQAASAREADLLRELEGQAAGDR